MTTHQKYLYQQRLFGEITHTLACIANGTDIAAGTLRQDLRQLLAEYRGVAQVRYYEVKR